MISLVLTLCLAATDAGAPASTTPAATSANSGRDVYVGNRAITKADLDGRSLYELTVMRNFIFARAHNSFRKKWLREFFTKEDWYEPADRIDESLLNTFDAANAEAIAAYEAALTRDQLLADRDQTRARVKKKSTPEDQIELRLLSERLGEWAGEGPAPKNLSPLEDPTQLDKPLTLAMLDDFSPRDLKLLRNSIFARRGRAFVTPMLQEHFATVGWYKIDPQYADTRLTAVDKKNVQLIVSLEAKLAKPKPKNADDNPEAWYGQA